MTRLPVSQDVSSTLQRRRFLCLWPSVLFIVVAASVYIFCPQYLMQGHDGKYHFVLLRSLAQWNDASPFGLSAFPLAGMSAVFPPEVPELIPTVWPFLISSDPFSE